jgi:hypothetical protein
LSLFSTSLGFQLKPIDKLPETMLDNLHEAFYIKLADCFELGLMELQEFEQTLRERYDSYYQILMPKVVNGKIEIGDDVSSKLARQFFDNTFREDRSYQVDKSPEAFVLVPLLFFQWTSTAVQMKKKLEEL